MNKGLHKMKNVSFKALFFKQGCLGARFDNIIVYIPKEKLSDLAPMLGLTGDLSFSYEGLISFSSNSIN